MDDQKSEVCTDYIKELYHWNVPKGSNPAIHKDALGKCANNRSWMNKKLPRNFKAGVGVHAPKVVSAIV